HQPPVASNEQIAKPIVEQKPQRYPRWKIAMQDVMPWLGKGIVHVLFPRTFASGKDAVGTLYGHREYVRLVVPVSVADHEHAVHLEFAEPRRADNPTTQTQMRPVLERDRARAPV